MSIQTVLETKVKEAVRSIFDAELPSVEFQPTRKDFEGDITVVVFPMLRVVKGNPAQIGEQIGAFLKDEVVEISDYNVVKGFLNLVVSDAYYLDFFNGIKEVSNYGLVKESTTDAVMVEYSSPNTNKPLHLGHIRNNLLGYSVAEILKASGKKVYKTQIINDRGIHICKSMLAWQRFGNGETPESTGLKGDKLVGNYYVEYNTRANNCKDFISKRVEKNTKRYFEDISETSYIFDNYQEVMNTLFSFLTKAEIEYLANIELGEEQFDFDYYFDDEDYKSFLTKTKSSLETNTESGITGLFYQLMNAILVEYSENIRQPWERMARRMLQKWEAGDEEVTSLWRKMNGWVYQGFDITYKNLGVDFDKLYYESDTYLLGKDFVADGLEKGIFYKKDDGSVWIDLTEDGLDEKIVLRSDGTAVYMTQDIGTAIQRVKDYPDINGMVYTVGNEQDYHFKVLFLILKKLGFSWAEQLHHLSYGMVDLPSGKMKSREGTVVDADDLMVDMTATARELSEELGKLEEYSHEEKEALYKMVGLGALKYYILKVDPKKRILFNPEESVDFQGNTGPFIQYTYARIQSILRKAKDTNVDLSTELEVAEALHPKEKELIKQIQIFPETIQLAAANYSPALIANYVYDLVKEFNSFYQQVSILGETDERKKVLRVRLSKKVSEVIESGFKLLGIDVPERM